MALKRSQYLAYDFTGGINTEQPQYLIDDKQLVQMENCTFDVVGLITSRLGYTRLNETQITSATKIPFLFRFYDKDGTTKTSFGIANRATTDLPFVVTDAGVVSSVTGGNSLTANSHYSGTIFKDRLYYANGVDALHFYETGTTASALSATPAPPIGKYLETHNERLWVSGDPTYPSRVYFCAVGDETDWNANYYLNIQQNDGGIVMGIKQLGQSLIVLKNNGVYRVWGNSTTNAASAFQVTRVPGLPGCIAPRSIVRCFGGLVWLSADGVIFWDGEDFEILSINRMETALATIDGADLEECVAFYNKKKYYLLFPDDAAYNENGIVYNFPTKSWSKYTNYPFASAMVWDSQDDENELYAGGSNSGYIYKLGDGFDDDGTAISVTIETKHIDGGTITNRKHWKDIIINALSDDGTVSFTVQPLIDISSASTSMTLSLVSDSLWGTGIWGAFMWGASGMKRERVRIINPCKSNTLGLKITWSGALGQMKFRGWEVYFDVLSRKG